MTKELEKITRAPLKPQQRLKILRCFLIPRWYHRLVLGGCYMKVLKALDRQIRASIRKWLVLPKDIPVSYFHTQCSDGGLGIPSLETTIPGLIYERMEALGNSTCPAAVAAHQHQWVQKKLIWTEKVLTKEGEFLNSSIKRAKWWANRLYSSSDGYELRECGKTKLSTRWMDEMAYGIPGRDYIQYNHVFINCLPTRIRTTRGRRGNGENVMCRAGCQSTETAAHAIQKCFRTHGGRILRHDAVCKILSSGLSQKGYQVTSEPQLWTTSGLRKPDIVAVKEGKIEVIDTQIVSGSTNLNDAHKEKIKIYNTPEVKAEIVKTFQIPEQRIRVSSCTISWRGVWSSQSAAYLNETLKLPKGFLATLTTRVLQGSHTNWTRWNQITTINPGHNRRGIG